jgi:hypothetical protein
VAKYNKSLKGKQRFVRYESTEKGRKVRIKTRSKHRKTEVFKARQHAHNTSTEQKQRLKNHYIANKPYYRAKRALYRAAKILATPRWLTTEHKKELARIYRDCPKGYHVDHIHPLNSKVVCGLHVPWNLQYLPASENRQKSNKLL